MLTTRLRHVGYSAALVAFGFAIGHLTAGVTVLHGQPATRVFEIRTYTAPEGKLSDLHKRFRDHTVRIFQRHGMTSIGYWTPQDAPLSQNTLIYILAHPSRDAAKQNWAAFQADPEWKKVAAESQVNGRIVEKVEAVFVDPTDYSPIK
ncbi:MAG TPA: NIPSNAP family protein [Vicinamibacterales bacterium]|nr:NIPSNAP family protein [Vicinamibacterales bacterium]